MILNYIEIISLSVLVSQAEQHGVRVCRASGVPRLRRGGRRSRVPGWIIGRVFHHGLARQIGRVRIFEVSI